MKPLALLLCLLPAMLATAHAAQPSLYGQGEDVYLTRSTLVRAGDVLYIPWPAQPGKAERFLIAVDIANPAQPRELGRIALPGFPQDVAIAGDRAYVVNGLSLITLDITSPAQMKVVHTLDLTDNPLRGPQAIDIDKHRIAWLACRRDGVRGVDLANPDKPALAAHLPLPGFARDVAVTEGGRLFVAADAMGLHVLEIGRGASEGSGIALSLADRQPWLEAPLNGTPCSLTIHDQVVYLAQGSFLLAGLPATGEVGKADDPWLVRHVGRGPLQVRYGSYAHDAAILSNSGQTLAMVADGEAGVTILDITNRQAPKLIAPEAKTRPSSSQAMLATAILALPGGGSQPLVCVLDQNHGLRVFELDEHRHLQPHGQGLKLD